MHRKTRLKQILIIALVIMMVLPMVVAVSARTKTLTASDSNHAKDIPKVKKTGTYIVKCDTVLGNLRIGFKAPANGTYTFKFSKLTSGNEVAMRSIVELDRVTKKKYIKQAQVNAAYLDTVDHKNASISYEMEKGQVIYPTILSPMLLEDGLLVSCQYTLKIVCER